MKFENTRVFFKAFHEATGNKWVLTDEDVQKACLRDIERHVAEQGQNGQSDYEISQFATKSGNPELVRYEVKRGAATSWSDDGEEIEWDEDVVIF